MKRRHFLASSVMMPFAGSLNLAALHSNDDKTPTTLENTGGLELLGKPYDPQVASLTYNPTVETPKPPTPNALVYYDKDKKAFITPDLVKPDKDKGTYSVSSTLRSFNISDSHYKTAQQSSQEVQIGLNFTAPITSAGDNFAWIVKNAINIFLGKPGSASGSLASFESANPQTPTTAPTAKVQVLQGAFDLQVNAFFQKKAGLWRTLFQSLGGVPGTPLLATLGIPGIALAGLGFVMYSLNKLTNNESLIPIWNPRPLPFALTTDVNRDFGFKAGLWCIVDSEVIRSTNRLAGHSIYMSDGSYQVLDASGKQLNANYVVAQFDVNTL